MDSIGLFQRWYIAPIQKLKELPNGDGAFAALIIALPLYERCIKAKLKLEGKETTDDMVKQEVEDDLGLQAHERAIFWDIFRIGFTHQAMGKAGKTKWRVSHLYESTPKFKKINEHMIVELDPWKFADRVLNKFIDNPRLINSSESFPFASIFSIDEN